MTSTHEHYAELLVLTKQYLLQEHALNDRIFSEPETYAYFKVYALQNQKKGTVAVSEVKTPVKVVVNPSNSIAGPDKSGPMKAMTSQRAPKEEAVIPSALKEKAPAIPSSSKLGLEPPAAAKGTDFTELRKIIREKLPNIQLLDNLPDDTEAKELANNWTKAKQTPQVLILSFDEPPKHQFFLANIAKTLHICGFPAIVANAKKIEWEKTLQSKDLKLIVSSSLGFHDLSELQKHHREDTRQGKHYIGNRPLLLLSDISFYLKEPALKPSLWKALKDLLLL